MNTEEKKIWQLLNEVPDPEIPVISVVELGVVRAIELGNPLQITITPTYVGCPAMNVFEEDIVAILNKNGYENVEIKTTFAPAWTTDWISEEAREKLRKYGIAPPTKKEIACPQCGSIETQIISQFGSTACKALYKCTSCLEPFDYFKCI